MTIERIREVLRDIQVDMAWDAQVFDGREFNGRTVAEYFGHQGAAIAALAGIVDTLIQDRATPIEVGQELAALAPPEGAKISGARE